MLHVIWNIAIKLTCSNCVLIYIDINMQILIVNFKLMMFTVIFWDISQIQCTTNHCVSTNVKAGRKCCRVFNSDIRYCASMVPCPFVKGPTH